MTAARPRRRRTEEEKATRPIEEILAFPLGGIRSLRNRALDNLELVEALLALRDNLDQAVTDVVEHHVAGGASWTEVAQVAGMTRQGAMKRWGADVSSTRTVGGQPGHLR